MPQAQLTLEEAEKLLAIDKNSLDDDLAMQPDTYYRVAKASAEQAALRDSLKYDCDQIIAETDARVRQELQDEADQDTKRKKPTEAEINNNVRLDRHVDKAQRVFSDATVQAARWRALELAFAQRAHALRDLTNLYTSSYFQTSASNSQATRAAQDRVARDGRAAITEARRVKPK